RRQIHAAHHASQLNRGKPVCFSELQNFSPLPRRTCQSRKSQRQPRLVPCHVAAHHYARCARFNEVPSRDFHARPRLVLELFTLSDCYPSLHFFVSIPYSRIVR